jgi:hypothetical protein
LKGSKISRSVQRTKPEKSPFRSHPENGEGDLAVAILARAGYQEVAATGKPGEEDFLTNLAADWTAPTSPPSATSRVLRNRSDSFCRESCAAGP